MSTPMSTVDQLRAKVTPKGPWFEVPSGTAEADCAKCDADALYWIITAANKRMLVDCGVPGGQKPMGVTISGRGDNDDSAHGRGVAHFATCPHAASFRRRSP